MSVIGDEDETANDVYDRFIEKFCRVTGQDQVNYGQDPFEILIDLVNKHDEALTSLTDLTDEVNRLRKLVPDKEALEIVLVAAESFITIIEDYPQEADAVAKYKAAIAKLDAEIIDTLDQVST